MSSRDRYYSDRWADQQYAATSGYGGGGGGGYGGGCLSLDSLCTLLAAGGLVAAGAAAAVVIPMLLMAGKRRRRRRETGTEAEEVEEVDQYFILNFIYGGRSALTVKTIDINLSAFLFLLGEF